MRLRDSVVEHDHPDLVEGLRNAIKNIEGCGDRKVERVAKLVGVPPELVKKHMEESRREKR